MQIVWTIQAQEDLETIYRFWLFKDAAYAARLYNLLIDEADILLTFPHVGAQERFLLHRPEQFRSLVVGKYHKLVYTIEERAIVIHAVWDCRQNPETLTEKA